ncbi:hypothetical protein ACFE04_017084 [Oxalis oulophora]
MTSLLILFYSLVHFFAHADAQQAEGLLEDRSINAWLTSQIIPFLIIFTILIILFLMYFCFCNFFGDMTHSLLPSRRLDQGSTSPSSAATIIEACPILKFYQTKDIEVGRGDIECVICLEEFQDDDALRLLPKCDHMFHRDCIDKWFARKVICSLCRMEP